MRVATYNVNGINGRLPRLLEWLAETRPDVVCLQELKTDDSKFPVRAIADAGYGAVWHGHARTTAWRFSREMRRRARFGAACRGIQRMRRPGILKLRSGT